MFRIEIVEASDGITMIIEGRFVSHFAEAAKQLIVRGKIPAELTVDISEITCVDSVGETALTWMRLIGAKFVAETLLPPPLRASASAAGHQACRPIGDLCGRASLLAMVLGRTSQGLTLIRKELQ